MWRLVDKFSHAFAGFKYLKKDKSVLLLLVIALITLVISYRLGFTYQQLLIVFLCCLMVISVEIINSLIELLCDLIDSSYNIRIKKIKDISSALVLFCSLGSVVIFILLCLERI